MGDNVKLAYNTYALIEFLELQGLDDDSFFKVL